MLDDLVGALERLPIKIPGDELQTGEELPDAIAFGCLAKLLSERKQIGSGFRVGPGNQRIELLLEILFIHIPSYICGACAAMSSAISWAL